MTPTRRNAPPLPRTRTFVPPYPPSWVDRWMDWVDRLPIPWWSFYVLLALAWSGIVALVLWQTGVYAAVGFHPMQVWLPTLAVYLLGLMHGLNRTAVSAMGRFRPAFHGDDAAFAAANDRMTTLPRRPTFIVALIGILFVPVGQLELGSLQTGGLEQVPLLFLAILAVLYAVAFPFFYALFRQLRQIHRLHRDFAVIRLANVRPIYALSRVTSHAALGIVIFSYGWLVAQPGLDPANPVFLIESLANLAIALLLFIWPLWGAHRLLAEKKDEALAGLAVRKEATRAHLHQAVDAGKLDRVDPLHKTLIALQEEVAELSRTPTWPWAPGTLRNLLGAVLLPMVLWLIQFGLQRLLG